MAFWTSPRPEQKATLADEPFDFDAEVERLERLFKAQYGRMLLAMHTLIRQTWGSEVEDFRLDDAATRRVLQYAGSRVVRITETTRAAIAEQLAIGQGLGLSTWEIANGKPSIGYRGIEGLFTETWRGRPDMVARTELQEAQRASALDRYYATGLVDRVKLIDGDDWDAPCRDRNGKVVPIRDAPGLAHPRCTLVLVPVLKDEVVADAQPTPPPAPAWGEWKTVQEAEAAGKARYPHIDFDFKGAHVDTINPTMQRFASLSEQYPQVNQRLRYVGTYQGGIRPFDRRNPSAKWGANTWAHATRDGEEIGLNPLHYGNPKDFATSVKESATARNAQGRTWHPLGTEDIDSVMTHEFGHQVENWLASVPSGIAARPLVSNATGAGKVSDEFSKWRYAHKGTTTLSRYAVKTEQEGFAEAFAAQYHSPAAVKSLKYVKSQRQMLEAIGDTSKWRRPPDLDKTIAQTENALATGTLPPESTRRALEQLYWIRDNTPAGAWESVMALGPDERAEAQAALRAWRDAFW